MASKIAFQWKGFPTNYTSMRFISRMNKHVYIKSVFICEWFITDFTSISFLSANMNNNMVNNSGFLFKWLPTVNTAMKLISRVTKLMSIQIAFLCKKCLTNYTSMRFISLVWISICLLRLLLAINNIYHRFLIDKAFSPPIIWMRIWRIRVIFCVIYFQHLLQHSGLCPVWTSIWMDSWPFCENDLPQTS